jgi:hypothetical protein
MTAHPPRPSIRETTAAGLLREARTLPPLRPAVPLRGAAACSEVIAARCNVPRRWWDLGSRTCRPHPQGPARGPHPSLGAGDDAQSTLSGAALAHARGDDHRARELFARAELVLGELAADDRAELDWLREHLRKPNSPAT